MTTVMSEEAKGLAVDAIWEEPHFARIKASYLAKAGGDEVQALTNVTAVWGQRLLNLKIAAAKKAHDAGQPLPDPDPPAVVAVAPPTPAPVALTVVQVTCDDMPIDAQPTAFDTLMKSPQKATHAKKKTVTEDGETKKPKAKPKSKAAAAAAVAPELQFTEDGLIQGMVGKTIEKITFQTLAKYVDDPRRARLVIQAFVANWLVTTKDKTLEAKVNELCKKSLFESKQESGELNVNPGDYALDTARAELIAANKKTAEEELKPESDKYTKTQFAAAVMLRARNTLYDKVALRALLAYRFAVADDAQLCVLPYGVDESNVHVVPMRPRNWAAFFSVDYLRAYVNLCFSGELAPNGFALVDSAALGARLISDTEIDPGLLLAAFSTGDSHALFVAFRSLFPNANTVVATDLALVEQPELKAFYAEAVKKEAAPKKQRAKKVDADEKATTAASANGKATIEKFAKAKLPPPAQPKPRAVASAITFTPLDPNIDAQPAKTVHAIAADVGALAELEQLAPFTTKDDVYSILSVASETKAAATSKRAQAAAAAAAEGAAAAAAAAASANDDDGEVSDDVNLDKMPASTRSRFLLLCNQLPKVSRRLLMQTELESAARNAAVEGKQPTNKSEVEVQKREIFGRAALLGRKPIDPATVVDGASLTRLIEGLDKGLVEARCQLEFQPVAIAQLLQKVAFAANERNEYQLTSENAEQFFEQPKMIAFMALAMLILKLLRFTSDAYGTANWPDMSRDVKKVAANLEGTLTRGWF